MIAEKYSIVADILADLSWVARKEGARVSLVGGVVRDILAYQDVTPFLDDIDLVVEGDARLIARAVAPRVGGNLQVFDRFFTAKITRASFPEEIDLVSARQERYETAGALPIVSLGTLHDDLQRRDFTMNAMALSIEPMIGYLRGEVPIAALAGEILDPLGGMSDLSSKVLRILHQRSFEDDPTRLFRAIRYGARLGASLCPLTDEAFYDCISKGNPESISAQRVLQELRKLSLEQNPHIGFQQAVHSGILGHFLRIDPLRAAEVPRAFERLAAKRGGLSPMEWWQSIQWILIWAGMERSQRIEAALERRRRDIAIMYREVDAAHEGKYDLIKSLPGTLGLFGLLGVGEDRIAELKAEGRGK